MSDKNKAYQDFMKQQAPNKSVGGKVVLNEVVMGTAKPQSIPEDSEN